MDSLYWFYLVYWVGPKLIPDQLEPTHPLLRAENQVSSKSCKYGILQNTIFKYGMGNGFAILIPFSI